MSKAILNQKEVHEIIKNLKSRQAAGREKLHAKSAADIDLLRNVYDYMKKRSEIELEYGKSMEKLDKQFNVRKAFKKASKSDTELTSVPPPLSTSLAAFIQLLDTTLEISKAREAFSDTIQMEITVVLKETLKEKINVHKKCLDFLGKFSTEFQEQYDEFEKTRYAYEKYAKEAEIMQKKHDDAIARPNSGWNKLLNVVNTPEDRLGSIKGKIKSVDDKLVDHRNEHLLIIDSLNIYQRMYYDKDLKDVIEIMDGNSHETIAQLMKQFVDMEVQISNRLATMYDKTSSAVKNISQEQDTSTFLHENAASYEVPAQFTFEQYCSDTGEKVLANDVNRVPLSIRLAKLTTQLHETKVELCKKEAELTTAHHGSSSGNENSTEDLLSFQIAIKNLKLKKLLLKKQIDVLMDAGVVPEIHANSNEDLTEDMSKLVRQPTKAMSMKSVVTGASIAAKKSSKPFSSQDSLDQQEIEFMDSPAKEMLVSKLSKVILNVDDDEDASKLIRETVEVVALYDYTAQNGDELTFHEGDVFTCVYTKGDENWFDGTLNGKTGLVPQNHVEKKATL